MELTPRDLGTERYLNLMRRRLSPLAHNAAAQNVQVPGVIDDAPLPTRTRRRGKRLRKYWVRDLNLDDETAETLGEITWKGSPGMGSRVVGTVFSIYLFMGMVITLCMGAGFPFALIALLWTGLVTAMMMSPRTAVRKQHQRAITAGEIDVMIPTAHGRLERTYLNLVSDVVRQNVPSASAQADIRAALRDLGDAISRLPADSVPTVEPATLQREAAERRLQAQSEADSFVRASLLRQAEAYDRRAALGSQNATSARRVAALRREARAQMDALRSVLLAFEHTSHADAVGVNHLAETVQRVALEAQAVAVARRELEEGELAVLLGHPLPENLPTQPAIPQRRVVLPTKPAENPPLVQSRNWWRGQS